MSDFEEDGYSTIQSTVHNSDLVDYANKLHTGRLWYNIQSTVHNSDLVDYANKLHTGRL